MNQEKLEMFVRQQGMRHLKNRDTIVSRDLGTLYIIHGKTAAGKPIFAKFIQPLDGVVVGPMIIGRAEWRAQRRLFHKRGNRDQRCRHRRSFRARRVS